AVAAVATIVIGGAVVLTLKRLYPPTPPPGPSAAVSVSAPALPTESAAPPAPSGSAEVADADALRGRLRKSVSVKDWGYGEKTIMALARVNPKMLSSDAVRGDVVAVAAGVGFDEGSEAADELFELLTHGLGSDGLDILFELARGRGATRGGKLA